MNPSPATFKFQEVRKCMFHVSPLQSVFTATLTFRRFVIMFQASPLLWPFTATFHDHFRNNQPILTNPWPLSILRRFVIAYSKILDQYWPMGGHFQFSEGYSCIFRLSSITFSLLQHLSSLAQDVCPSISGFLDKHWSNNILTVNLQEVPSSIFLSLEGKLSAWKLQFELPTAFPKSDNLVLPWHA